LSETLPLAFNRTLSFLGASGEFLGADVFRGVGESLVLVLATLVFMRGMELLLLLLFKDVLGFLTALSAVSFRDCVLTRRSDVTSVI